MDPTLTPLPVANTASSTVSMPLVSGSTTPAASPAVSKQSAIIGLLYTLGVAAAAIFVKVPAHVATAGAIVDVLTAELSNLEALL